MNGAAKVPLLSLEEALAHLVARAVPVPEVEHVATQAAVGRVLARPVRSDIDVPGLDNSAMDGYAVRCADLPPDGDVLLRISQRVAAGTLGMPLEPGTAARIFTGAPLPPNADAVVMQEDCTETGERVWIRRLPARGLNVRRAGEDIAAGTDILPAGRKLRPQELGLAASVGLARLPVRRRVRVGMFFTGDEIVMAGEALAPGQIYNSNRYALAGLLAAMGCAIEDHGIVPDDLEATCEALRRAAGESDLVLTSGGVSVGEEDHVKRALAREGRLDLWRIAIKPGKPLAYGQVGGAHFLGLPGNPVSAFVTFCLIARPFILRLQGVQEVAPKGCQVRAGFSTRKPDARREFLRARIEDGPEGSIAMPYGNQGSGVLTSLCWGDGLLEIPPGRSIERGEWVRFLPFAELAG